MKHIRTFLFASFCGQCAATPPQRWPSDAWDGKLQTDDERKVKFPSMIGNGWIGAPMEIGQVGLFLSGVFNGADAARRVKTGDPVSHRARVPNPLNVRLAGDQGSAMGNEGATLDVQRAVYSRMTRTQAKGNLEVLLEQHFYTHRTRPSLLIVEFQCHWQNGPETTRLQFADMKWEFGDFNGTTYNSHFHDGQLAITEWVGSTIGTESTGESVVVAMAAFAPTAVEVRRDVKYAFAVAYRTSLDAEVPREEALKDLKSVANDLGLGSQGEVTDSSKVLRAHTDAWAYLWESGLTVDGRPDVEKAAATSAYYILSSIREDRPYSLSPGSLASNAYNGHSFWDTETWMYPPILALYPNLGRSLLQYRVDRVHTAELKARSYDPPYKGAMFPWESASTGVETCPPWAAMGQREQHISAVIVLAVRQWFYATHDVDTLRDVLYPLVMKVADFWVDRSTQDKDDPSKYHILKVIPPDEYVKFANDSIFTNFAASEALRFAAEAAILTGHAVNPRWMVIAQGLVLPFDEKRQAHLEYDGYMWGQKIKQADVILLPYPLGLAMPIEVLINDLAEYESVTDPKGPAMTWSMHSIGYISAGSHFDSVAANNFDRGFANVKQPFGVWTETVDGGAVNFITGAGGFLQSVINGYFGVRIAKDHLKIEPKAIRNSTAATLRGLHYVGRSIAVSVDNATSKFTIKHSYGPTLVVESVGEIIRLAAGDSATFTLGSFVHVKVPGIAAAVLPTITANDARVYVKVPGIAADALPTITANDARYPFIAMSGSDLTAAAMPFALIIVVFCIGARASSRYMRLRAYHRIQ